MTPDEFAAAGRAMFGERWQADMTDMLGLNDSSRVRQFLSGRRATPHGIRAEIIDQLRARGQDAVRLAQRLSGGD